MPANALHRAHPRLAARREHRLRRGRESSERRLRAVPVEEHATPGYTWTSIVGDLPARGSTYAIAEDHVDPQLLFAGTEFGAYWSKDGGQHWSKIAGLPTIAVREIAIQKRENDLVLGTFGRGVYIVDDYSPLRATTAATLAAAATLYPVRDAVMFVPTLQYGMPGKGFQGEMLYTAPNPPYGAVFTYRLKDGLKT